jgi:outer membrane protein TolC
VRRALTLAAALLLALPAAAQNARPPAAPPGAERARPLTLDEAERLLVERNLAVIAAQRGVDQARALRLVASSLPPGQVTVGNTFLEFQERQRGGPAAPRGRAPDNNLLVGLTMLVELGGKRELRTRLAEENIGVAEALVLDALRGQVLALRQGFYAALGARANLDVALATRASLERTEALLRRQVQDGARAEVDLLTFQASRPAFEAEVPNAAQAYAAAAAQVAVALALDAAVPAQRVGALPALPIDLRGRFDRVPEPGVTRDALAEAVARRPDVVAAERLARAGAAGTSLAEAARWRDVTVNGTWGRSQLSQDQPTAAQPLIANNQFTVSLGVPIFTRRIVEGNIGAAQGAQAQAEVQARAVLLQARAEFATAWSAQEQARALLRLYTGGALSRAEQAYRSTETAYLAGGRTLLEVLDTLRTLNATRIATNNARAAYLIALAQLEAASGVAGLSPRP